MAIESFTFIGTAAFTAAGQIRYEQIGADTIIQGNVKLIMEQISVSNSAACMF